MTRTLTIPDPRLVFGLGILIFSAWLALEGILILSITALPIASGVAALGWRLRKSRTPYLSVSSSQDAREAFRRWLRFTGRSLPVILAVYVVGYFVLIDRQVPTHPAGGKKFESSLRWAPKEWVHKAVPPYQTPFGPVTTWNLIYAPMERVWFHYVPRSPESVERLREAGYYR